MKKEDKKKIEALMAGLECPKGFKCVEGGCEGLCKAKDFGLDNYLDCLEKNPRECPFAIPFGRGHLCRCPLRIYIAKHWENRPEPKA